jgi:hypothetical protein
MFRPSKTVAAALFTALVVGPITGAFVYKIRQAHDQERWGEMVLWVYGLIFTWALAITWVVLGVHTWREILWWWPK